MLILKLNGIEVPDDQHNLNDNEFQIDIRRNQEDDRFEFSFTSTLTLFGDAYLFVKSELFDSPQRDVNKISVEIFDDCCSPIRLVFTGEIVYNSLTLVYIEDGCFAECKIDLNLQNKELTETDYFATRLINADVKWEDNIYFRLRTDFPFIYYCEEYRPFSLRYMNSLMYIALAFLMWTVMIPFNLILAIINTIISVLNAIPGVDIGEIDIDGDGENNNNLMLDLFFDNFNYYFSGCGKGHPSPYLRQYIKNAMIQANVTSFTSTILNDPSSPYYNLSLHSAPNLEGYFDRNDMMQQRKYFDINSPNMTVGELLDELSLVFNAEWWVEGNTLFFEKKKIITIEAIDFTTNKAKCEGGDIIHLEITTLDDEEIPRGLEIEYQLDGYDSIGNESRDFYNDVVPFDKIINNPNRKGIKTISLPFGSARFRYDGIYPDFQSSWGVFEIILNIVGVQVNLPRWERWLLMNAGKASLKKLLILEPNTPVEDAKVIRKSPESPCANYPCFDYNAPMWVNSAHPNYNSDGRYNDPANTLKKLTYPNLFEYYQNEITSTLGKQIVIEVEKNCSYYNLIFNSLGNLANNVSIKVKIFENIYSVKVKLITITNKTIKIEGLV